MERGNLINMKKVMTPFGMMENHSTHPNALGEEPKWRSKGWPETVCLQRDSLDLYVDGTLCASQPISHAGMQSLKSIADDVMHNHTLFQIKIRNRVQWESRPTQVDLSPNQFSYEVSVL